MSSPFQTFGLTVCSSLCVAGIVGYGTANYAAGGVENQVAANTQELRDRKPLVDKATGYEVRLSAVEAKIEAFQALVIDGQKEQRTTANQILYEISLMRKDTAVNSTRIGAIEVDVSEINKKINK